MKRTNQDVAGRRFHVGTRRDVAGWPVASRTAEVASYLHALDDPFDLADFNATSDSSLVEDFAEFLMADADDRSDPLLTPPDPVFRDRLRKRLWRLQLLNRTTTTIPQNRH